MTKPMSLKEKLGLDVFKHGGDSHIKIMAGAQSNERLKKVVYVCPAGLYSLEDNGDVVVTVDGCLECGTCRIACGPELLEWCYPDGGTGVQFRFG